MNPDVFGIPIALLVPCVSTVPPPRPARKRKSGRRNEATIRPRETGFEERGGQ